MTMMTTTTSSPSVHRAHGRDRPKTDRKCGLSELELADSSRRRLVGVKLAVELFVKNLPAFDVLPGVVSKQQRPDDKRVERVTRSEVDDLRV